MIAAPTPPIGAMVARARRTVIRHLTEADAITPETAVAYTPARGLEKQALRRLVKAGAVHEVAGGKLWLDEPATDAVLKRVRKRIGIGVALGVAVAAAAALFAG